MLEAMTFGTLLALILSGLQMVVFTLLGIPYGVLFAVAIGFTTLIPYASALTIVLVSVLLALEDPRTGLEVLRAEPLLRNTVEGYAPKPDYRPLTKFENRGLKLGHGVWDLVWRRV